MSRSNRSVVVICHYNCHHEISLYLIGIFWKGFYGIKETRQNVLKTIYGLRENASKSIYRPFTSYTFASFLWKYSSTLFNINAKRTSHNIFCSCNQNMLISCRHMLLAFLTPTFEVHSWPTCVRFVFCVNLFVCIYM